MKTPQQIADEVDAARDTFPTCGDEVRELMALAIEADRAQRQPEIYIVQNDGGDVVAVFRDSEEASAAYQFTHTGAEYSIIEETVSEPGEYAEARIAALTTEWEEATGDTASDYILSEDDWLVGLDGDDAAEVARLMEWRASQGGTQ